MAEPDIKVVGLSSNKSNNKTNWKVISAIVGIIVLALGVIAGIILVRQNQDIREQASCTAQCPSSGGELVNCYNTADTNGEVSLCNTAGRIEICGQNASTAREYCCPSAGGSWSTNLTLCSISATPTATATATSTATSSASATASATSSGTSLTTKTATPTATATASGISTPTSVSQATATAFPVPETGADWPTILGAGFGVIMIFASLFLAL